MLSSLEHAWKINKANPETLPKSAGNVSSEHDEQCESGDFDKLYQKLVFTDKLSGLRALIGVDCIQVPKSISGSTTLLK